MARRKTNSPRHWQKYPNTYARTTDIWTTRYYNRKADPQFNLLGLDTTNDDFHKKEGSSPYLANVRYMGEREENQRAQVMSRKGTEFIGTLGEDDFRRPVELGTRYIGVYEGKAIQWRQLHNKILTGITVRLMNPEGASGYVKFSVRNSSSKKEVANGIVDTETISRNLYTEHSIRFMRPIIDSEVYIRAELVDDLTKEEAETRRIDRRTVRILAETSGDHEYAEYELPNTDDALVEVPYTWSGSPNVPLVGVMVNDWQNMKRNHPFTAQKKKWEAFPVFESGVVTIYKRDLVTNEVSVLSTLVSNNAKTVRFAQAEGFLYYVDGESPLRRVNLTTWATEDVIPKAGEITIPGVNPATLTAKPGASLIHFLNNRIYLSGFRDDPNLTIQSLIDDVKPRFEQYDASGRFYSPDQSPEASAASPITALADINNYLVIFRVDGISMYDRGGSTILEDTTQVTPEGSRVGVMNQEAVAQGKGNIFFYSPTEGVCRFGGSTYKVISNDIENWLDRIKRKEDVVLMYHNKRLRLYTSFTDNPNDTCLYYYSELEGRLPWYHDKNQPVLCAFADNETGEIYARHSEVASGMKLDTGFKDFDSVIEMEYHLNYRVPPTSSPEGKTVIRRVHVHEIADSDHSLFIGIDIDHRDQPIVWRKIAEARQKGDVNPDAIFQHTAEDGIEPYSIHCLVRCRMYQVRLKRYCYKDHSEVIGVNIEYGDRKAT